MALLDNVKKNCIPLLGVAIAAIVIVIGVIFVTNGFGFDSMHSPSKIIEIQSKALLKGNLYVYSNIKDLRADMVWHNGKVQQVWGLGVALLRAPFYVIASIFGVTSVPEGYMLSFYIFLTVYIAGFVSYLFFRKRKIKEAGSIAVFIMCLIGFFPAAVILMRSRFIVYEEVIMYGYLYSCTTAFLALAYSFKPESKKLFYLICFLAGFAGLVRPTLFAYTFPIFIGLLLWSRKTLAFRQIACGCVYAALGITCLLVTNHIRFGSAFEFGHHVNVAADLNSVNLTRFESAYTTETPLYKKLLETVGIVFLIDRVPMPNGLYLSNMFPFQAPEIRWRHIIFPTIHWYHLIAFILLGLCIYKERTYILLTPLLSFALLFVFYSASFIISSRYLADFATAFALAFAFVILYGTQYKKRYFGIGLILIALLYSYNLWKDIPLSFRPPPALAQPKPQNISLSIPEEIPESAYTLGTIPGVSRFNGAGWNMKIGILSPAAIFFVKEPQFITLKLKCVNGTCEGVETHLNALLDGEALPLKQMKREGNHIEVMFEVKKELAESSFMQVLFLQISKIGTEISKPAFILEELRWRE